MSTTTTQARDGASGASAPPAAALKQKKVAGEDAEDAAGTAKGRPALSGARPDEDGGNESGGESGDESMDSDEPGSDADAAPPKKGGKKKTPTKKARGGGRKAPAKKGGKQGGKPRASTPRKRKAPKTTAVYKNRVESVNKNRVFVNATFVTFIKCVLREELGFGNRVRKDLLFALAEVHRQWAEGTLEAGTEAAAHCKRKTIMPADVDLLRNVRKLQNDVNFTPAS